MLSGFEPSALQSSPFEQRDFNLDHHQSLVALRLERAA
jgi:hypothetical protein